MQNRQRLRVDGRLGQNKNIERCEEKNPKNVDVLCRKVINLQTALPSRVSMPLPQPLECISRRHFYHFDTNDPKVTYHFDDGVMSRNERILSLCSFSPLSAPSLAAYIISLGSYQITIDPQTYNICCLSYIYRYHR